MDFAPSARSTEMLERLQAFMAEHVLPAEAVYAEQRRELATAGRPHDLPPVVEELKAEARSRGLWNLFLPEVGGLSLLDYAPLAELSGWSPELAPEAMNCAAPDTGNMEVLHLVGTDAQKGQWLEPAAGGRDPVRLRDDRAGRRLLGRPQHRDLDPSRRRRLRHRRPQVVDHRRGRPPLRGARRHGPHRPGGRAVPPAVDGARPDGRARADPGAVAAGVRLPRPARPRRDRPRRRPRAGGQPARRRGRRVRDRPAAARAGPRAPLHAGDRDGGAGPAPHGRAGPVAHRLRAAAGPARRRRGPGGRGPDGHRAGPAARAEDRLADRHARRAGGGARRWRPSRWSCRGWPAGSSTTRSRCTAGPA